MNGPLMLYNASQLLIIVVLGVFQLFVPRLTRPDVWFAVTVDPSFRNTDDGRRIERLFRKAVITHTAISLLLGIIVIATHHLALLPLATIWLLLGSTIAFLRSRRLVLPFAVSPATQREATLTTHSDAVPGGPLAQLGPFAILGGIALWLADRWESIPAQIPVHYNAANQVDRWATKSIGSVFAPVIIGVGVCVFLALTSVFMMRSRRIHASGPLGRSEARFRRTTRSVMLGAEYLLAIVFSVIAYVVVTGATWLLPALIALSILFVIGTIVVLAYTGQGGSRLAAATSNGAPAGDRTQDVAWKWGLFYVNPNDPALFVEKRFGIGYTLNFGNRWALPTLGAMLLFPLALTFVVTLLTK